MKLKNILLTFHYSARLVNGVESSPVFEKRGTQIPVLYANCVNQIPIRSFKGVYHNVYRRRLKASRFFKRTEPVYAETTLFVLLNINSYIRFYIDFTTMSKRPEAMKNFDINGHGPQRTKKKK